VAEQRGDRPLPQYLSIGGTRSPDHFHRELGKIIWDYCGMERTEQGLEKALSEIPALHDEFKKDLRVTGSGDSINQTSRRPAASTTSSSSGC
jgi:succinate dehydrogenase / fumarate reductase, flavoprotein subunit